MPSKRGTRVYVLTEDGFVKGVTVSKSKAEAWMNLGNMYDYLPMELDEIAGPEETIPPTSQAVQYETEQLDKATGRAQQQSEQVQKTRKKLFGDRPIQSALLQ